MWTTIGYDSFLPRSLERHLSFSFGYVLKGVYGRALDYLSHAQYGGAGLITRVEVNTINPEVVKALSIVELSKSSTSTMLKLPRYRQLLTPLSAIIENGSVVISIEGNKSIMASVLAPTETACLWLEENTLWKYPFVTKPSLSRYTLVVDVFELSTVIQNLRVCGLSLEHLYDY